MNWGSSQPVERLQEMRDGWTVVGRSVGWLVDRENCGVDGISIEDGGSKGKEKMVELEEEDWRRRSAQTLISPSLSFLREVGHPAGSVDLSLPPPVIPLGRIAYTSEF